MVGRVHEARSGCVPCLRRLAKVHRPRWWWRASRDREDDPVGGGRADGQRLPGVCRCGEPRRNPCWPTRACCRRWARSETGWARCPKPRPPLFLWHLGWGPAAAPSDRFLVGAGALSLLAAEAERAPVLVLVDDLQWIDRETVAALGFAAGRLRDDRCASSGPPRRGSISPELVARMPVLTLSGLSGTDARALVPERLADRVARAVRRGHQWQSARRLSRSRAGSAPPSGWGPRRCPLRPVGDRLGGVYPQQLTGLSAPAWRAVLLSALNRSGTAATVAASLAQEGLDVAAALDEAQDQGVLARHGAEWLRHPLLRTAVLARATSAQQRSAHRALAEVPRSTRSRRGDLAPSRSRRRPGPSARAGSGAGRRPQPDPEGVRRRLGRNGARRAARERRSADRRADGDGRSGRSSPARGSRHRSARGSRAGRLGPAPAKGRAQFRLGMLEEYTGSVPGPSNCSPRRRSGSTGGTAPGPSPSWRWPGTG